MNNKGRPRVLVCPLDWGLGHASRCIPIIRELVSQGAEVMIAGEGFGLLLLKDEFPELPTYFLKGYRIAFSSYVPLSIKMLLNLPQLIIRIIIEHSQLAQLTRKHSIDIIISDNRYGLWNKNIHSILITHQLNIIPPRFLGFTAPFLRWAVRFFIRKYNECLIPDSPGLVNISGNLSHGYSLPSNVTFIGPLSRFYKNTSIDVTDNHKLRNQLLSQDFDIIALLSGPEPQRSQLEDMLKRQLNESSVKSLMLRGITGTINPLVKINNLTILDHLPAGILESILRKGPVVICRGGYSTLMDMAFTGNKVICIPTPGQTEQEYLAKRGDIDNQLVYSKQSDFSLIKSLKRVAGTVMFSAELHSVTYSQTISKLIKSTLKNRSK